VQRPIILLAWDFPMLEHQLAALSGRSSID
jgi:hypothetical protein